MGRGKKGKKQGMIRIGVHTSISGGLWKAIERAEALGCNTLQMFCHSPRSWQIPRYSKVELKRFISLRRQRDITPVFVHCSYLINLSSPNPDIRKKSIELLSFELEMVNALEADYLVLHPGRAAGQPLNQAISMAAEGIKKAVEMSGVKNRILLENTAGQKGDISSNIPSVSEIVLLAGYETISGICIDTCHAYQAGYDIASEKGADRMFNEIEKYLHPLKIELIHINDSKKPFSSGIDRHEHIGEGFIGEEGFRYFLSRKEIRNIPLILETPKKSDNDDKKNIKKVKVLLEK